jgi:hypothetical protein
MPAADIFGAAIGDIVWQAAAKLHIAAPKQTVLPDNLKRAPFSGPVAEGDEQAHRMIVARVGPFVDGALDGFLDQSSPTQKRMRGEVDFDEPHQHRGAVVGSDFQGGDTVLAGERERGGATGRKRVFLSSCPNVLRTNRQRPSILPRK